MNKKVLIALAELVRSLQPDMGVPAWQSTPQEHAKRWGMQEQWEKTRESLADFCASQNPAFERDRWLDYIAGECVPNDGAVKSK